MEIISEPPSSAVLNQTQTSTRKGSSMEFSKFGLGTLSLAATPIQFLSRQEAQKISIELMMESKCQSQIRKSFRFAGISPSRFNLPKITSTLKNSKPTKRLWDLVRCHVLKIDTRSRDLESAADKSMISQGFRFGGSFRQSHTIISVVHHARIPNHYMDGILDSIPANTVEIISSEIAGDTFDQREAEKGKNYQISTIDSRNIFSIYDIAVSKTPKIQLQLFFKVEMLIFLSRNCMYGALVQGHILKFFTAKLDVTSSMTFPHQVQL